MTLASLAMLAFSAAMLVAWVWLRRRTRTRVGGSAERLLLGCAASPFGLLAMWVIFINLSHGSELSNLGDGLVFLVLAPLHLFGWTSVAIFGEYFGKKTPR